MGQHRALALALVSLPVFDLSPKRMDDERGEVREEAEALRERVCLEWCLLILESRDLNTIVYG